MITPCFCLLCRFHTSCSWGKVGLRQPCLVVIHGYQIRRDRLVHYPTSSCLSTTKYLPIPQIAAPRQRQRQRQRQRHSSHGNSNLLSPSAVPPCPSFSSAPSHWLPRRLPLGGRATLPIAYAVLAGGYAAWAAESATRSCSALSGQSRGSNLNLQGRSLLNPFQALVLCMLPWTYHGRYYV